MGKKLKTFFVVFSLSSFMTFAQWTDTIQKKVFYVNSVYVTPGSKVFHKDTCKLLTGGKTGMVLETAEAQGYKPCLE